MLNHLITLYSRVTFVPGNEGAPANRNLVTALSYEIASYGYSFEKTVLDRLVNLSKPNLLQFRSEILPTLSKIAGADARHAVLFNGFPYSTPDQHEYMIKRVLGHICNIYGRSKFNVLSCGHVINDNLFKLNEFGACPICQQQVDNVPSLENILHDFSNITPMKMLGFADENFIVEQGNLLLGRGSSLSADEKTFLSDIGRNFTLTRPNYVFRENIPFVYSFFDDLNYVSTLIVGATDILRIATFVSNPNADLSLKNNTRFKLSTKHKRSILVLLEGLEDISEDMLRNRERWLRLGEIINPGSNKNRLRYPNTAEAFDDLRNCQKSIPTFNRFVEKHIRCHDISQELLNALTKRPGEFARRLDVLLRNAKDPNKVLNNFMTVIDKIPGKMLLEIFKYFQHRALNEGSTRVFFPKGQTNKIKVLEDRRLPVDEASLKRIGHDFYMELIRRQRLQPTMGKVFIDDAFKEIILPFNRRGDSSSNIQMKKGGKYPINPLASVIRLFVHWSKTNDVDLSVTLYGDDFVYKNHVAFTNLRVAGVHHSGDIQRGYNGASEFIDFDIQMLLNNGIRYVVSSVISYTGGTFNNFPCFAGFMERDALASGARFEPESVALKFDLTAPNTSHTPLIFDLAEMKVIFADIASGNSSYRAVSGRQNDFMKTAMSMLSVGDRKPTVYDLLEINMRARGTQVATKDEADISFVLGETDIENLTTEYLS